MAGYIQTAIAKIKAVDVEQMKALRKRGHKTIRFKLEEESRGKRPATASVPLAWILESREKYASTGKDAAFSGFVSDWVSNWV